MFIVFHCSFWYFPNKAYFRAAPRQLANMAWAFTKGWSARTYQEPGCSVKNGGLHTKKTKEKYAKHLILVRFFRINSKCLTSKFWFSHGLISNILVQKGLQEEFPPSGAPQNCHGNELWPKNQKSKRLLK